MGVETTYYSVWAAKPTLRTTDVITCEHGRATTKGVGFVSTLRKKHMKQGGLARKFRASNTFL